MDSREKMDDNNSEEVVIIDSANNKKLGEKSKINPRLLPTEPDPFWPDDIAPGHLSREQQDNKEIVSAFEKVKAPIDNWKCTRCGTQVGRSSKEGYRDLCNKCAAVESQVPAAMVKTNDNWMETAKELGLELYERQPEETNEEWRIWVAYRSYYPLKLPTYSELARVLEVSSSTVTRVVQRWGFKVRMIEWARATDASAQEKRMKAIREMNEKQLVTAQYLQDKLRAAVVAMNPDTMKPSEIATLLKVATDMERTITTYTEAPIKSTAIAESQKSAQLTRKEDMTEIIKLLQDSGVVSRDVGKTIGIETKTTRIIVKEGDSDGDGSDSDN